MHCGIYSSVYRSGWGSILLMIIDITLLIQSTERSAQFGRGAGYSK